MKVIGYKKHPISKSRIKITSRKAGYKGKVFTNICRKSIDYSCLRYSYEYTDLGATVQVLETIVAYFVYVHTTHEILYVPIRSISRATFAFDDRW